MQQNPAFAFWFWHPDGCWFRQSLQRRNTVFYCGSSYHVNDNRWGSGYSPALNLCGYYRSLCILLFPLEPEYTDVCPNQVWYKCSARRKKRNRGLRTCTFSPSRRRLDSAIYSHDVSGCSPSTPCGIRHHTKESHHRQDSDVSGWSGICHGWSSCRWKDWCPIFYRDYR